MSEEEKNPEAPEVKPESSGNEPQVSETEVKEEQVEEPQAEAKSEAEAPSEPQPEPAPEKEPEVIPDDEDTSKIKGEEVNRAELNRHIKPGMVVRVHEIIKDVTPSGEERKRTQVFEGTVLGLKSSGIGRTMTVRKVSKGFGVEKIYPLASPNIEKVEVVKTYRVRRAKLNYLRGVIKRGRVKKRFRRKLQEIKPE